MQKELVRTGSSDWGKQVEVEKKECLKTQNKEKPKIILMGRDRAKQW